MGIFDKIANALGSGPKTFNVLVVGLDNSGKSTILNSLKVENKCSPQSIAPTVGAQIEKIKLGNVILQFNDMSGQGKYRPMWERCLNDSQAIVFVVDLSDRIRLVVAKEEFDGILQHPALTEKPHVPYLILANKKDLPNTLPVHNVAQMFELERLLQNRPWQVKACNGLNAEEVRDAFKWILDYLENVPTADREAKPRS